MSNQPLFDATIEPDDDALLNPSGPSGSFPSGNIGGSSSGGGRVKGPPVVLTPGPPPGQGGGSGAGGNAEGNASNAEMGISGILKSSSHPMVLLALYFFRSAALAVYVLCGLFTKNYVLSIVIVVVLLSLDFWNVKNVAGRTLVGLRYWNEIDENGEGAWVFECRDPSRPANPVDEKMFWLALYIFPLGWVALLFVSIFTFNISFLPIVVLALIFNVSNALGFTYADRDAKKRWANQVSAGMNPFAAFGGGGGGGLGGIGGQLLGGAVRSGLGRVFR